VSGFEKIIKEVNFRVFITLSVCGIGRSEIDGKEKEFLLKIEN
jgi:hypothetical protein